MKSFPGVFPHDSQTRPISHRPWAAVRVEVAREEPDADVGGAFESLDPCFLLD